MDGFPIGACDFLKLLNSIHLDWPSLSTCSDKKNAAPVETITPMRYLLRLVYPIGFLPDFTNHQPSTINRPIPSHVNPWNLPWKYPLSFPNSPLIIFLACSIAIGKDIRRIKGISGPSESSPTSSRNNNSALRARKRPTTETTCCCTLLLGEVCLGRKLKISPPGSCCCVQIFCWSFEKLPWVESLCWCFSCLDHEWLTRCFEVDSSHKIHTAHKYQVLEMHWLFPISKHIHRWNLSPVSPFLDGFCRRYLSTCHVSMSILTSPALCLIKNITFARYLENNLLLIALIYINFTAFFSWATVIFQKKSAHLQFHL